MAVNEAVSAYSTTAASNTPAGSDNVGPDLDNHLRDIKKNVRSTAESFQGQTPAGFRGQVWLDRSGSPTYHLSLHDGGGMLKLYQIDASANNTFPMIGSTVMGSVMRGLNQDSTASAATKLALTKGTNATNIPDLITGSATSVGALRAHSGENLISLPYDIVVACSDETTELLSATTTVTFRMPRKMELSTVRASATAAPSATATFDINEGGSTILSTKLTIDGGTTTSLSAATTAVISDTTLADDAVITVDIDGAGGGGLKGLKVAFIGYTSS